MFVCMFVFIILIWLVISTMPIPPEIISQLEVERRRHEAEVRKKENEILAFRQRIREIDELLNHASKLAINWSERAMNCLRSDIYPMTTDEILRCVFVHDLEELANPNRRRNYIMQLSLTLNRLCGKKLIVGKTIEGFKGKIYYLRKWENDNGELKPEYKIQYNYKVNRLLAEREKLKMYG